MKIRSFFISASIAFFLTFAFASCEEEGPDIRLEPPPPDTSLQDTTYVASSDTSNQEKKVLIEDFTAVQCNNCPKASDVIKNLENQHPGRIVAVGIHCGALSQPLPESDENYRIKKGESLYNKFGRPSQPNGMIDRVVYQGNNNEVVGYQQWETKAQQRLQVNNDVNVYLSYELDSAKRELKVQMKGWFTNSISGKLYFTVGIIEDNIIDYQKTPNGTVADYEHDHVLRKILTSFDGSLLYENPGKRRVVIREFRVSLEQSWKVQDLSIFGFVHRSQSENTVLQANKIKVE